MHLNTSVNFFAMRKAELFIVSWNQGAKLASWWCTSEWSFFVFL